MRMVWPNERRGRATSVPFIVRLQQESPLFSRPPNFLARSRARRSLPLSKYSPQYWHGNHSRNKPRLALRDRAHPRDFAAPAKKYAARRERARSSIHAENEHRQFASSRPVYSIRGRSSVPLSRGENQPRPRLSFLRPDNRRTSCSLCEQRAVRCPRDRHRFRAREELAHWKRASSPPISKEQATHRCSKRRGYDRRQTRALFAYQQARRPFFPLLP